MEGILRRGLHIRSNPRRGSILALPWQEKDLSCLYNILWLKELLQYLQLRPFISS